MAIVNKINELTKDFGGMKVPVKIIVNVDTKEFEVEVGTPTTSALIVKELGIEKGSGDPGKQKVGNLTIQQVIKIAKMKRQELLAKNLKKAAKEVLGSCVSMGSPWKARIPERFRGKLMKASMMNCSRKKLARFGNIFIKADRR